VKVPATLAGERVTVSTALPLASATTRDATVNPIVTTLTLAMVQVATLGLPRLPLGSPESAPRATVNVSDASARRSSRRAKETVTKVSLAEKDAVEGGSVGARSAAEALAPYACESATDTLPVPPERERVRTQDAPSEPVKRPREANWRVKGSLDAMVTVTTELAALTDASTVTAPSDIFAISAMRSSAIGTVSVASVSSAANDTLDATALASAESTPPPNASTTATSTAPVPARPGHRKYSLLILMGTVSVASVTAAGSSRHRHIRCDGARNRDRCANGERPCSACAGHGEHNAS
jgi:hypothetical protein